MDNQDGSAVTAKSAAEFITRAVLCGAAKLTPYTVEEDNYCADETYAPGTVRKTTVKYWAAYFPSFWNPYEDVVGEEEAREKVTEAEAGGNQTPFWPFNAYLDKFVGFHQLLKSQTWMKRISKRSSQSISAESKNEKSPSRKISERGRKIHRSML